MGRTNVCAKSSSGSMDINGIIEEYEVASGGNVSAGDFVTYVNNFSSETDTRISTISNTGEVISAVQLDENKIFIAHSYNSNKYLYGIVCTIDGTTITKGTDTQLIDSTNMANTISAVALNENKVFIAHNSGANYNYMYGIVCTIDGTSITKGTDTQLGTETQSMNTGISAVALSENKVFIAHNSGGSNGYLYGVVCTISETTITKGTDTKLSTISYTGDKISVAALNEEKVFIAHSYDSVYYLYGIICTINNRSITKKTDTLLDNNNLSTYAQISVVALNENKVFIVHNSANNKYCLSGIVCTINGTTIVAGINIQLSTIEDTSLVTSSVMLSKNKVLILHGYNDTNYYLYKMICRIIGTTIITDTDTRLSATNQSGYAISSVLLSENKTLIAHSYGTSYTLSSIVINAEDKVKQIEDNTEEILGVAKKSGTEGQTIQVYTPQIN